MALVLAALRARREPRPPGPGFPVNIWFAALGVDGRELSGEEGCGVLSYDGTARVCAADGCAEVLLA